MALISTNTTVFATAGGTRLAVGRGPTGTSVKVHDPAAPIWLGGSGVTVATGQPLATGATFEITLPDGDELYGIANTATTTVRVMVTRQ